MGGTFDVAETLAEITETGCVTIIGGGDSVAAVEKANLADKMSHISTGGGASLGLLRSLARAAHAREEITRSPPKRRIVIGSERASCRQIWAREGWVGPPTWPDAPSGGGARAAEGCVAEARGARDASCAP